MGKCEYYVQKGKRSKTYHYCKTEMNGKARGWNMEPDETMNPRNLMEEFWSVWWAWMDELQGRAQMPCGLVVVWSS